MNKADLIRQIKREPYKIAQAVGFSDVREFPHNEWMREILLGTDDYTLMAHRGSYKSSVLSVCIALMMVLFPQTNIIFLRKADNDVSEMIRMVKRALESDALKAISMVLYRRQLKLTENTTSTITTNLYLPISGSSQLLGIGLKSSITGKHAGIVITDDICNITDRISKAERDRTKLQYQELQNIRNRGGRIINLGTKWHKDDVFTRMKNVHTYDYLMTGLISKQQVDELRASMTPALFACNYELKIIADEDTLFQDANWTNETELIYDGFGHIDASYGGEDGTAYTVMHTLSDGRIIAFGKLWHKHVDECVSEIMAYQEHYRVGPIYNERNADKGYLAQNLEARGLTIFGYNETMNKYIKISSFLRNHWKNIYWLEDTDPEYMDQILDYNINADHDDAPDSAASLLRETIDGAATYIPTTIRL